MKLQCVARGHARVCKLQPRREGRRGRGEGGRGGSCRGRRLRRRRRQRLPRKRLQLGRGGCGLPWRRLPGKQRKWSVKMSNVN